VFIDQFGFSPENKLPHNIFRLSTYPALGGTKYQAFSALKSMKENKKNLCALGAIWV
jgi:hypothetical protein